MTEMVHPEALQFFRRKPADKPWVWREPSRGEHFRTCSWCGSIHPEDLVAEQTWTADWADRKYGWPHKFYVDITNRNPNQLFVVGLSTGTPSFSSPRPWKKVADLSDEERTAIGQDGWSDLGEQAHVDLAPKPSHHAKFYTAHLADPTLPQEVKEKIEARSGLHFEFTPEGRVTWQIVRVNP